MKIFLAVEGVSDVRRARVLVDRWLRDNVEWFSPEYPEACREFVGLESGSEHILLKEIHKLHREMFRQKGGFGGGFGGPHPSGDAGTIRYLRMLLKYGECAPDVVLWLRDCDGDDNRSAGAINYIREHGESERFILGYAQEAGEAWVLVGWEAESEAERAAQTKLENRCTRKLPRDAHLFPHHGDRGVKWAARELGLTGAREEQALLRAWTLTDSTVEKCGLAAFRREMNTHTGLRRALGLPPGE